MNESCATCRWSRTHTYPAFTEAVGVVHIEQRTCHRREPCSSRDFPVVRDGDFCPEYTPRPAEVTA